MALAFLRSCLRNSCGSATLPSLAIKSHRSMSSIPSNRIHSHVTDRLTPHGSGGLRTSLAGVVDLDALENGNYEDILGSVEARLSTAQVSIASMLVAGIYFGVLVGWWLLDTSSWAAIARWSIPVLLVTSYAVYASYQTIQEIRELAEARSLLLILSRSPRETEP